MLNSKVENWKINEIKKYLPLEMEIDNFPSQQKAPEKLNESIAQNKSLVKENEEDIQSEETKYTIEDSCKLISQLNEKIKKFRKENMPVKEKEKKIKIKEDLNFEESEEESDESNEINEDED